MNGECIYLQDFIQRRIIWEKRVFLSTLLEEHQQIFSHFNNWKIFIPHFLACHIHEHRERFFHLKRSILNEGQKINCPNSFSSHFQRFFFCVSEHSEMMIQSDISIETLQKPNFHYNLLNSQLDCIWSMLPVKEFKNDELTCCR